VTLVLNSLFHLCYFLSVCSCWTQWCSFHLQSKLHTEKYISTTLILIRYHLWGAKHGGIYYLHAWARVQVHACACAHTPNYLHIKVLINKNK
jgi:hypothetical protein